MSPDRSFTCGVGKQIQESNPHQRACDQFSQSKERVEYSPLERSIQQFERIGFPMRSLLVSQRFEITNPGCGGIGLWVAVIGDVPAAADIAS
jgi:hypothetical protein